MHGMSHQRRPTLAEYREPWAAMLLRRLPAAWGSALGAWLRAHRGRKGIAASRLWVERLSRNLELIAASPQALRQLCKALAAGRNLLLYVNEVKDGFVWAPSLGRRIPERGNRWLAARLAVRYRVDLLPVSVERIGPARFRILISPKLGAAGATARTRRGPSRTSWINGSTPGSGPSRSIGTAFGRWTSPARHRNKDSARSAR
jgi:hypothetical protein